MEAQLPPLKRSIQAILTTPHSTKPKPPLESFECLNLRCRVLVLLGHRGQDVHNLLRSEFEISLQEAVKRLAARALLQDDPVNKMSAIGWLNEFVTVMEWFHGRVVGHLACVLRLLTYSSTRTSSDLSSST